MVDVTTLRRRVDVQWNGLVSLLSRKIALRSVSALGVAGEHMRRSAEFVAGELRQEGVAARAVQATGPDGSPGAWEVIGSRIIRPDAPTVLLYAHHDVQPVPDPAVWHTDPFTATERDGRLYGRGSSDDGGGIVIHVGALKALGDDLHVNVKVFIEGEEEMGSPSFIPFIRSHRREFDADVIIVADSGNWAPEIPSLTTSLRGNAVVDVTVRVLTHPVHSGQYGGPILDARTVAAMLIAGMYDGHGALAVPGLLGGEPAGGLERDVDGNLLRRDTSLVPSYRMAGVGSLASRLWTRPSATVIGFDAHPVEGAFNVIADAARFRLSLRVAPTQDAAEAQRALAAYLTSHAPFGSEVSVTPRDASTGWAADLSSPAVRIAERAMGEAFETPPIDQGQGGSIPFIPQLQRLFSHAQVLVTGPEDPLSNAHSPNESVSLAGLRKGTVAEALILSRLDPTAN